MCEYREERDELNLKKRKLSSDGTATYLAQEQKKFGVTDLKDFSVTIVKPFVMVQSIFTSWMERFGQGECVLKIIDNKHMTEIKVHRELLIRFGDFGKIFTKEQKEYRLTANGNTEIVIMFLEFIYDLPITFKNETTISQLLEFVSDYHLVELEKEIESLYFTSLNFNDIILLYFKTSLDIYFKHALIFLLQHSNCLPQLVLLLKKYDVEKLIDFLDDAQDLLNKKIPTTMEIIYEKKIIILQIIIHWLYQKYGEEMIIPLEDFSHDQINFFFHQKIKTDNNNSSNVITNDKKIITDNEKKSEMLKDFQYLFNIQNEWINNYGYKYLILTSDQTNETLRLISSIVAAFLMMVTHYLSK
jgi:hypothetical protein